MCLKLVLLPLKKVVYFILPLKNYVLVTRMFQPTISIITV